MKNCLKICLFSMVLFGFSNLFAQTVDSIASMSSAQIESSLESILGKDLSEATPEEIENAAQTLMNSALGNAVSGIASTLASGGPVSGSDLASIEAAVQNVTNVLIDNGVSASTAASAVITPVQDAVASAQASNPSANVDTSVVEAAVSGTTQSMLDNGVAADDAATAVFETVVSSGDADVIQTTAAAVTETLITNGVSAAETSDTVVNAAVTASQNTGTPVTAEVIQSVADGGTEGVTTAANEMGLNESETQELIEEASASTETAIADTTDQTGVIPGVITIPDDISYDG